MQLMTNSSFILYDMLIVRNIFSELKKSWGKGSHSIQLFPFLYTLLLYGLLNRFTRLHSHIGNAEHTR
jgi:hypothetical protein